MQDSSRNQKIKEMVQVVMNLLDRDVIDYPYVQAQHFEPTPDGLAAGRTYVVGFSSVVEAHKSQIERLPEFLYCLSELESSSEISRSVRENGRELLHELILRTLSGKTINAWDPTTFFTKYLEARPTLFKFDEDIFNHQYSQLERVISSGNLWLALAPLGGYESESQNIDFGSVSIRKISEKQLSELWNVHGATSTSVPASDFRSLGYCLWSEQKTQTKPFPLFDSVVRSLRLWKTGSVGYGSIFVLPLFGHLGEALPYRARSRYFGNPGLVLKSDEVENFKTFFHRLKETEHKIVELDIALSRFDYSYERHRSEDRLIDLTVAYESLFCEDSIDLAHKLSTRVARFLEHSPEKREKLRENIREAYKIRSEAVHGNKRIGRHAFWQGGTEKTSLGPNEYLPLIEDYLRRCLRSMIFAPHTGGERLVRAEIMKKIDFGP